MSFLETFFYFSLSVSCLIFVHEFGHFAVGRLFSVKVEIFSIGFGRSIFAWVSPKTNITYRVGLLPIGGFVKFTDKNSVEDELAKSHNSTKERCFDDKSPFVKILIAFAGPLANLVFALIIFLTIFSAGPSGLSNTVGSVLPGSIAESAGVLPGDKLISIGGRSTNSWEDVVWELSKVEEADTVTLFVQRTSSEDLLPLELLGKTSDLLFSSDFGLEANYRELSPVIGKVVYGGGAHQAGMLENDLVLQVEGTVVSSWVDFVSIIRKNPNSDLNVLIRRGSEDLLLKLRVGSRLDQNGAVGWIGASYGNLDQPRWKVAEDRATRIIEVIEKSYFRTQDVFVLSARAVIRMCQGKLSTSSLSGPIGIANLAADSGSRGVHSFLYFLAVLSVSIALVNLLPLPVLDGGQIILFCSEWVRGSPFSDSVMFWWTRTGIVIIFLLMGFTIFNDVNNVVSG